MKKVGLLLCLIISSICVYSQKSYVIMAVYEGSSNKVVDINLNGDVPIDMNQRYENYISDRYGSDILNLLAQHGFEVEQMSQITRNYSSGNIASQYFLYLLSKKSSSTPSNVRQIVTDDENVTEVARYNLQGMPVYANEKGIQIIVYSNYTTKTVIVQ